MTTTLKDATFGAKAHAHDTQGLPTVFPREMGPNTVKYLKEVVDAGLASDMVERFEGELAALHGVKHAIGTPGCTQALFAAMLGLDFEPGDELRAEVTGTCIRTYRDFIDWQSGEDVLQLTGVLQDAAPPNDAMGCPIEVELTLSRRGSTDPAFEGGTFFGEQVRVLTLMSTP